MADQNLLRNVLNDLGAQPSEVFLLVAALEARIPQTLIEHTATNDLSVVEPRLVADLNNRGIERARAEWAVSAWKEAVGASSLGQPTMIPSQPTPSQPVSSQPVSSQPTPSQGASSEPATVLPSQPTPSQGVSSEPATMLPSQPTPSQPTPSQPAPSQPAPSYQPGASSEPATVLPSQPAPPAAAPIAAPAAAVASARGPGSPPPPSGPMSTVPTPQGGGAGGGRRTGVIVAAIVVALVVIGVVAFVAWPKSKHHTAGGPSTGTSSHASTSAHSSTSVSASSSTAAGNLAAPLGSAHKVTVPGTVSWTPTGLVVAKGERINITATGQVANAPGNFAGPNGAIGNLAKYSLLGGGEHHAGLIGLIAGSGSIFFVGANYNGIAQDDGVLYLGINDIGVGNNSGQYTTTIRLGAS
jgi:hypothetical protein